MTTPTEINREIRGHRFFPTTAEAAAIPQLGEQEERGDQALVHLHYFSVAGDWWLTEVSMNTDSEPPNPIGFGFVRLAGFPEGAEWGYVDLVELEELLVQPSPGIPIYIERDRFWEPKPMAKILKEAGVR